jgi:Na+/proline symporter
MSSTLLLIFVGAYFILLLGVAYFTSRNSDNDSFFVGNRNSNWMLVAFGMIGTSLSGVTFVSVPGTVGNFSGEEFKAFSYFQVVLGYFLGYFVIAYVLLPLYYRLKLTSIYDYLKQRFGFYTYKTGSLFFIISRTIGATARLYLVINVLQIFILDDLNVPFWLTTIIILIMIVLYTFEGGVKTIVYTDTLQTTLMLLGLVVCTVYILSELQLSFGEALTVLNDKGYTKIFNTDVSSNGFYLKQIIGGAFIAIAMTGLDQEMMQKNISVSKLKDSQKNIITFSSIIVLVNFLFLFLGGLLYLFILSKQGQYVDQGLIMNGTNIIGDDLFPTVALSYLPTAIGVIFIIGLISALFPSADGALTALTSSFCIDLLGLQRREDWDEAKRKKIRLIVHASFTVIFFLCILVFKLIGNKSIIYVILDVAGYTYGPLLGLFAFGILTKRIIQDSLVVTAICLLAPIITYLLKTYSAQIFNGYQIGIELLIINGILTFLGLLLISKKK